MKRVTARRLREVLHYDPETGVFTWRPRRRGRGSNGAIAGTVDKDGYRVILVDGQAYPAHRLAHLHKLGRWPRQLFAFRNGDRCDLRWKNLVDRTKAVNQQNQLRAHANNRLGVLGVRRSGSRKNPFVARIMVDRKLRYLGSFPTVDAASLAYWLVRTFLGRVA